MGARQKRRPAIPKRDAAWNARAEKIGQHLGIPLALPRTVVGYVLVSATMAAPEAEALLKRLEIACEESHELAFGKGGAA
jgi:hypothetical protein